VARPLLQNRLSKIRVHWIDYGTVKVETITNSFVIQDIIDYHSSRNELIFNCFIGQCYVWYDSMYDSVSFVVTIRILWHLKKPKVWISVRYSIYQ
jgi:hypothetical protein